MQRRNGRRGANFTIRLTDAERAAIERAQATDHGPRSIGPWLVWRALLPRLGSAADADPTPARAVPGDRAGEAVPGDRAGEAVPGEAVHRAGNAVIRDRVVLDLCGGSGSWSAPYRAAGYDVRVVTLPDDDIRTYTPPPAVWGILAAPPCTEFSCARNGRPDVPRDVVRGLETVAACMRVILTARPRWWALENPTGLLSRWLGTPRDVWQPCDFGDRWTKRTGVWGEFTMPTRGPFVEPLQGMPGNNAAERAVTPPGFARAFFAANP
jgi:hypothetical protein